MKNISLYFHYPFCIKRCYYCDFVTACNKSSYSDEVLSKAFSCSIKQHSELLQERNINTVFFGGGTPSLMSIELLEDIFSHLNIGKATEISIEVNPATVNEDKFRQLKAIGFNRISIGVQAFNDKDLQVLGRAHSLKDSFHTIELARKYFNNVSIDIIYARPNHTIKSWKDELHILLNMDLEHISLYQLTIENEWKVNLPSDQISAKMFNLANDVLQGKYIHYEISNYAKKGYECKHNMVYWQVEDFLGIGVGAHSRVGNKAIYYDSDISKWVNTQDYTIEVLDNQQCMQEKIIMGLRISQGLKTNKYIRDKLFHTKEFNELVAQKLLVIDGYTIKPTEKGLGFNDYIVKKLIQYF